MKRQSMEWNKAFANDAIDKGLIFKIYKQLICLNIKKLNQKVGRRPNKKFLYRPADTCKDVQYW